METPVEHRHPQKRNLGFQESVSTETCSSTYSLAMGLHVKIPVCFAEFKDFHVDEFRNGHEVHFLVLIS
jgi:hypothetical protein